MKYGEKFITENADDINWVHVSVRLNPQDFSMDFFRRFKEYINPEYLSRNGYMTDELREMFEIKTDLK